LIHKRFCIIIFAQSLFLQTLFSKHFFQNVTVNRLNTLRYEGTHSATFQHSIVTEDEDFSAAFLRPVLLTLSDDSECPANARKIENKTTRVRSCGCIDDYYIIDTDPKYCDSVIECGECPTGMICTSASNPSGQIFEDALIMEGWYRLDKYSREVMQCPEPSTQCLGNATHGDALCANGHEGPFCMVCQLEAEKRYVWSGQKCRLCDGSSRQSLYGGMTCLGLLVVSLALYLFQSGKGNSLPGKTHSKNSKIETFFELAQTKYKILITFTQILSKVATLYPIQLPSTFLAFWGHFSVFSFDLSIIPINCIIDSNFHDRLVAMTMVPLMFLLGMLMLWLTQRQLIMRRQKEEYHASLAELTSKTLRLSIICIFTVFPMVSTTIFQV
jgi:hypothetical protein